MSEQNNSSSYLDDMSLQEVKNSFGEGYIYREKKRRLIEEKRNQRKKDEKTSLIVILIIFVSFVSLISNQDSNSSNSTYSQKESCVEKNREGVRPRYT